MFNFLNIIFPPKCLECKKEGSFICEICFQKIELKEIQQCPICKLKINQGEVCEKCKKVISGHEVEYQKMSKNFTIAGLSAESEIPKCPHCGNLAFFGMQEAKGTGL